jgi:hypothetical protein
MARTRSDMAAAQRLGVVEGVIVLVSACAFSNPSTPLVSIVEDIIT